MKFCKKCVYPETKPDLTFDKQGVCDACRSAELKEKINWSEREKEFKKIVSQFRNKSGNNYDCIIPVSGGKDSHYQTYICKVKYCLNPLLVSFEPTPLTNLGEKNLLNISKSFGCDLIHFRKNPVVYVKLARIAFKRVGDHSWPNHVGIYTTPIRIAINYRIPLIIWGENPQLEYGGPPAGRSNRTLDRRWLEEFGGLLGNRIEDMMGVDGLTKQDLLPYIYPSETELAGANITSIFLGSYFKWDPKPQTDLMIKKYGFSVKKNTAKVPPQLFYKSLDDDSVFVHDYFKFIKYGFDRINDEVSTEIRNRGMTRWQGVKIVKKYAGKINSRLLNIFLKHYNFTKKEFTRIVDTFANKAIFATSGQNRLIRDQKGDLIPKYFP